jgi:hypothetical protein
MALLTVIDCSAAGSMRAWLLEVQNQWVATAQLVAEFVAAIEAQLKPV